MGIRNSMLFPISRLLTVFVLFIVFAGPTSEAAVSQNDQRYDVLILGGGFAGITAAKHLHEKGVKNVLVIEAQDYIGGRLKNTQIGGYTFGEGANWVHYLEKPDNPIRDLAKIISLEGHEAVEDIIVKNGELTDFTSEKNKLEEADRKIQKLNKESMKDAAMSETLEKNGWSAGSDTLKRTVEWYWYDYEYTIKPDVMSTRNYFGLPEENMIVTDKRGYAEIINLLMKDLTGITIKTNTTISQVIYRNYLVTVKTKTGETFRGKYALCTFSTGVLRGGSVTFKPPLPQWKMSAVKKLPMGYYTHVLVQFSKAFWDNNEFIINIAEGLDIGPFPVIYNVNKTGLHPGSNLLLFTAVGDEGRNIEDETEEQTKEKVKAALKRMYPTEGDPEITAIFISKWSKNPHVLGSYSYASVGTTKDDFANLMGRVGNLFFAGEACDADYFGYLQGAYRTGFDQADIIATCVTSGGIICPQYTPKIIMQ